MRIPQEMARYDPIYSDQALTFDEYLDFGDAEERWELVAGYPVAPRLRGAQAVGMASHANQLLSMRRSDESETQVSGYGTLVQIDERNALFPAACVADRVNHKGLALVRNPLLVVEVAWGGIDERAVLHERRALYQLGAGHDSRLEYVAIVATGSEEHRPLKGTLVNFLPFSGRRYIPASPANTV